MKGGIPDIWKDNKIVWNPVKELKASDSQPTAPEVSHRWNPVKELKVISSWGTNV